MEKILRRLTVEEKQLVFGFGNELANNIYRIYNQFEVNDFEMLKRHLSQEQVDEITLTFLNIGDTQIAYLKADSYTRRNMLNDLRENGNQENGLYL
ncbi:hypothetical protein [Olivibacter domesticus]|nr:hypothetical protein [Olivibacter domesticus]